MSHVTINPYLTDLQLKECLLIIKNEFKLQKPETDQSKLLALADRIRRQNHIKQRKSRRQAVTCLVDKDFSLLCT